MSKKVAIVTPCITNEYLRQCFQSVQEQTYDNLRHYVIVDGIEHWKSVHDIIESVVSNKRISPIYLSENIGKEYYGHRAFAASSFLVNADVIMYLDADNWYQPNHVETMIDKLNSGFDWVYSLRNICDKSGEFLCQDNCESLGKWPVYGSDYSQAYHIDTGCFAIPIQIALQLGHSWYGKWGADRQFFNTLKQYYKDFECTGEYTLNYRLDGNSGSVSKKFFEDGNAIIAATYNGQYPWQSKDLIINTEIK